MDRQLGHGRMAGNTGVRSLSWARRPGREADRCCGDALCRWVVRRSQVGSRDGGSVIMQVALHGAAS
jgi:hypothetical protein